MLVGLLSYLICSIRCVLQKISKVQVINLESLKILKVMQQNQIIFFAYMILTPSVYFSSELNFHQAKNPTLVHKPEHVHCRIFYRRDLEKTKVVIGMKL